MRKEDEFSAEDLWILDDFLRSRFNMTYDDFKGFWGRTCSSLAIKNKKLEKALEVINNVAPPMYKYNEVELEMVRIARKSLENK